MEIFTYTFFQNALFGLILVSIASAIIGTYVVVRRMVFISGGITHASFGGLGLGYFLGISPIMTAAAFAVASALGVEWLSEKKNVREDSAIAVVWAFGMAIGTLFIFLTEGYVPELTSFLFGDILTISRTDLVAFAVYLLIVLGFFGFFYHLIVICAFDKDFARTLHLPVKFINYAMIVLIAVGIVLTIRLIGIVLLMSMFTLPQMIAEIYTSRLRRMMVISVIANLASSILAFFVSYIIDVPVSAAIVLTLVTFYILARGSNALFKKCKLQYSEK